MFAYMRKGNFMNTGNTFKRLVKQLIKEDDKYDNELNAFVEYLEQNDLLDKCFDLSISDINRYFDSLVGVRIGAPSALNAHIAALSSLFQYLMMKENYNFRELHGYINMASFRTTYLEKIDTGSKKAIIPMDLLQKLLCKMDEYFNERDKKKSDDKYYHLMLARLYIELSLLIPLKPGVLLELKLGDIKTNQFRKVVYNFISIRLPKDVRDHIIETVNFAEHHYGVTYSDQDALFFFLYNAIDVRLTPSTITWELQKLYKALDMKELLETYKSGTRNVSLYTVESYKKTAIFEMLNNGVSIVYLKQLTGLDIGTLLADYDVEQIKANVDVKSFNINSSIVNTDYYSYL